MSSGFTDARSVVIGAALPLPAAALPAAGLPAAPLPIPAGTGALEPAVAPVTVPVAAPVAAPDFAPVAAPDFAPVAAPDFAPAAVPDFAPVAASDFAPVAAPDFVAPVAAPVAVPDFAASDPEVAAGACCLSVLSVLSFGPAATLAARSNEENTTTVEVARMRNLQPALAGDLARTWRRNANQPRIGAFSCGMLQL
jgi:hypothetical protein